MSGSSVWSQIIPSNSFYEGAVSATPQALFGTYSAGASADAHAQRATLIAIWLGAREDAPTVSINTALGAMQTAQQQDNVGATSATEPEWAAAANTADQTLDALCGTYLSSSADDRAIEALRDHGALLPGAPVENFNPLTFIAALSARGITLSTANYGLAAAGGPLSPDDAQNLQKYKYHIVLYLLEA